MRSLEISIWVVAGAVAGFFGTGAAWMLYRWLTSPGYDPGWDYAAALVMTYVGVPLGTLCGLWFGWRVSALRWRSLRGKRNRLLGCLAIAVAVGLFYVVAWFVAPPAR